MLSSMTGPAAAGTITPVTRGDDGIPPDSLLQSETYISAETNARFKTAKPNKADFVVEEGKEVDLATPVSVESESKMEVQMTKSVAETVTPVHKVNRSVEVNVKRPRWLSEDWKFERKFCTNGASAGTVVNRAETNVRFKTAKPNKADFVVEEGKEVDLATPVSVESESKMEVQMTKSVAETVTPVHKVNRSVEVNVKRPRWLSEDWKFERKFCTNGASAGTVDNYYYDPVSGTKFQSKTEVLDFLVTGSKHKDNTGGDATPSETRSSKKQKKCSSEKGKEKITYSYFDAANPPVCVCWVQTDSCADTWTPFID
ncbi:hypothetical protein P3S68_002359 [Capsicum galapagoense]